MRKIVAIIFFSVVAVASYGQQEPNDCVNAITVCGNGSFSSNAVTAIKGIRINYFE